MKVVFLTNVSSPYRTVFFNQLGKYCDLDVWYEYRKEPTENRDKSWENDHAEYYHAIYEFHLNKLKNYDLVIVCGISTPKEMIAISYMKMRGLKYVLEIDGGFLRKTHFLKKCIKYVLTTGAYAYLSTGDMPDKYLLSNGAKKEKLVRYHFSSTTIERTLSEPVPYSEKKRLKNALGLTGNLNVIFVGRFVEFKGIDILLKAVGLFPENTDVCLIGGSILEEHKKIIDENNLKNIHVVPFIPSDKLREYYKAADLLVFPSRNDIWGLVINEAMAMGLPVICSKGTVAGLELVKDNWNGWIFETEDYVELARYVFKFYEMDFKKQYEMMKHCIQVAHEYTIESMVDDHISFMDNYGAKNGICK